MNIDVDIAVAIPVNLLPLIDDTDFKTREVAITYDQAGMDLVWNFVTSAGVMTQTAVTPTTGGDYDWTHVGDGMYKIEIPASGGASINNDTEGYGWFTGICTGVLAWRSPVYTFRAADDSTAHNLTNVTEIKLTVKTSKSDTAKLIEKTKTAGDITIINTTGGIIQVAFVPSDTNSLEPGTYYYDLEYTDNSKIRTAAMGDFTILEDITRP